MRSKIIQEGLSIKDYVCNTGWNTTRLNKKLSNDYYSDECWENLYWNVKAGTETFISRVIKLYMWRNYAK